MTGTKDVFADNVTKTMRTFNGAEVYVVVILVGQIATNNDKKCNVGDLK